MCIAIHKPAGVKLSAEVYNECFTRNREGAGMAYVEGGELKVSKGFFNAAAAIEEIRKHEEGEMLIHFRIQTHGLVNEDNCHPFLHNSEKFPDFQFAMMHNGTLPYKDRDKKSDTRCFAEDIIFPMVDRDPWALDGVPQRWLIRQFIGDRNKIVIMRYQKSKDAVTVYIINDEAGTKELGCWFSNTSFRPIPVVKHERFGMGAMREAWENYDSAMYGRGDFNYLVGAFVNEFGWYEDPKSGQWKNIEATLKDRKFAPRTDAKGPNDGKPVVVQMIEDGKKIVKAGEQVVIPFKDKDKIKRVSDLKHLTKAERKQIHGHCSAYIAFLGLNRIRDVKLPEQVGWLRDDLRDNLDEFAEMDDIDIDFAILRAGAMGKLRQVITRKLTVGCTK